MADLELTHEEAAFLVNFIPPHFRWPQTPEDALVLRAKDREEVGGAPFRLKILAVFAAARRNQEQATFVLPLTPAELWLLDRMMWHADYQMTRMPNGTPMLKLVSKVWDLMMAYHEQDLPRHLQPNWKPETPTEAQQDLLDAVDRMLGRQP